MGLLSEHLPLSKRIAAELRAAIMQGELAPGAVLPSERQIIAQYGTTKATAGKALPIWSPRVW
ncbi:GntR family transcriptional regulator [Amycolatopsis jejuensis]|uniref:GntR family transcriptional regulator n=1 Tax=Amycolatopsis jejuensis TaxID=330084 RepID=UPI0006924108